MIGCFMEEVTGWLIDWLLVNLIGSFDYFILILIVYLTDGRMDGFIDFMDRLFDYIMDWLVD